MHKMQPLVSVVIPSHNRPELLKRAINSVLSQTYSNVEIIVVDDASDMDMKQVLSDYSTVRLMVNEENRGPCYSRNKGITNAKGAFINFLDDDDILYPEKIEKQVSRFISSDDKELGMVTCHALDERSGEPLKKYNKVEGNIYRRVLSKFLVTGIETMLFRTSFVREMGGFDEELASSQEYDLLIRFSKKYTVDYVDEVLTQEFRSINQISTNFDKKIKGAKYLYKKHDRNFREFGLTYWLRMQIKLRLLIIRFYVGKYIGEKAYRSLIVK